MAGRKFVSGAAAGAASTVCTYPLDLLRARMAVEQGQVSFRALVLKVVQEEGGGGAAGAKALFRGVGPTLTGIVPYSGTAWLVKETVGENLPLITGRQLSTTDRVLCGITGGLSGQLLTYPLDVTRRCEENKKTALLVGSTFFGKAKHDIGKTTQNKRLPPYRGCVCVSI